MIPYDDLEIRQARRGWIQGEPVMKLACLLRITPRAVYNLARARGWPHRNPAHAARMITWHAERKTV